MRSDGDRTQSSRIFLRPQARPIRQHPKTAPLPTHRTDPSPEQLRAGEHSDYGSFTLLFQDAVGGLEVCNARGEWIEAPFIPETVLVNTGDLMQRWTNHVFCSTKHRVRIPQELKAKQSRYSIAFFVIPTTILKLGA